MKNHPFLSVVIPVFNDTERLKLCLAALENQTYPQSQYEIIVIDNGSEESQVIEEVVAHFRQATMGRELIPGSYAARNKGIQLARGTAIAFTDADCIPAKDWLEKGVERLSITPNCGLVSGKIEIFPKDSQRPTAVELFEMATAFPQEQHLQKMRYGATANLFTWKQVLQEVGNFNETLKSGGDLDWGVRVHEAGYTQVYAPEVVVRHPARTSFQEIRRKTIRLAGGHYDLLKQGSYHFFYKDSFLFALSKQNFLSKSLMREAIFLIVLLQDLIPPVMYVITSFKNPKLKTFRDKMKVACVIIGIRYTSAWAKLQFRAGKVPTRC